MWPRVARLATDDAIKARCESHRRKFEIGILKWSETSLNCSGGGGGGGGGGFEVSIQTCRALLMRHGMLLIDRDCTGFTIYGDEDDEPPASVCAMTGDNAATKESNLLERDRPVISTGRNPIQMVQCGLLLDEGPGSAYTSPPIVYPPIAVDFLLLP